MTLTKWDSANGPGATDYRTKNIIIDNCDGNPGRPLAWPRQSYRVMSDQAIVTATDATPDSDDRFQRLARVHLSHPACLQMSGYGGCERTTIYSDDLASVWGVHLMGTDPIGGVPMPQVQIRLIQAVVGNQVLRGTFLYTPKLLGGSPSGLVQLHGWESTDLEIWGWIDPMVNGSVSAALTFMVTVKMAPSNNANILPTSSNGYGAIMGQDVTALP